MRSAGFTLAALLVAATLGRAQPPAVSGQPVVPVAKAADPKLDAHLGEWEKKMANVVNFRTEIDLTRTDAILKKGVNYKGVVLCMKPNFAVLRLNNAGDKTGADYEAYICNGKAVYAYNGAAKTITEFPLPQNGAGVDNLMIDFLAGMKAKDVKERFDISLFKTDENYIYLDIKPLLGKDQREFKHLRMALYGPGAATVKFAYLPAQVYMVKPNDDTEVYKFGNPQVDLPGVTPKNFDFVKIDDPTWKFQKAPPAPVGGAGLPPAGGALPPGAVRPNR